MLWHDRCVFLFAHIVFRLLTDLVSLAIFPFRSRLSVEAENLLLRRQLGLYRERGVKPRRVDAVARASLAFISRLFDWRSALVIVRPETMIRWHCAGWRLLWRWKSRPGRPPIPLELRKLIRRMAIENPTWGEERIANELLLKLRLRVSPRTVRKYMPIWPPGGPRGDQRWSTFLRNHAHAIVACDFFVTVTATFQLLYVLVAIEHGSRRLLHMNVTRHPTSAWTLQQLREAIGYETNYQYLLHDRDTIFARSLDESIANLGLRVLKSPPRRWPGSIRSRMRPSRSLASSWPIGFASDSFRLGAVVDAAAGRGRTNGRWHSHRIWRDVRKCLITSQMSADAPQPLPFGPSTFRLNCYT